jgi:hypothetical protein
MASRPHATRAPLRHLTPRAHPCATSRARTPGLRALIFSGDHDLAVPHTGTEAWTAAMHSSNASACATAHGSTAGARSACGDGAINAWQPWYNSKSPRQVRDV